MPGRIRVSLLSLCLGANLHAAACAAEPTFAELLDRATAQVSSGRQWSPPGDNATETFLAMSRILSSATSKELAAFEVLLHREQEELARIGDRKGLAKPSPSAGPAVAGRDESGPPAQLAARAAPQAAERPPVPPAAPAAPPVVPPGPPPVVSTVVSPGPAASDLFAHGEQAEARGDISGARRFYASAALLGHAASARALGRLYDPGYIRQNTVGGIEADAALSRYWTDIANSLGGRQAAAIPEARIAR